MSIVNIVDTRCQKCHTCRRECPVKAIKTEDSGYPRIVEEKCITCGVCINACTQGTINSRDDSPTIGGLLRRNAAVAVLDPSFPVAFPSSQPGQVIAGLKALGFGAVHIASSAAPLLILDYKKALLAAKDTVISSACPAVVSLVAKHYPDLVPLLAPVMSLAAISAKLVRTFVEPNAKVIFVGPCAASKLEAQGEGQGHGGKAEKTASSGVDAAITFEELAGLFSAHKVYLHDYQPIPPDPFPGLARQVNQYDDPTFAAMALPGGFSWLLGIYTTPFTNDLVVACGEQRCLEVMTEIASGKVRPKFVDAAFCRGCVDAPGFGADLSLSQRKRILHAAAGFRREAARGGALGDVHGRGRDQLWGQVHDPTYGRWSRPLVSTTPEEVEKDGAIAEIRRTCRFERSFSYCGEKLPTPTEKEITDILAFCDLADPKKQLNCGMCGYPTCRELAIAVYQGFTREDACVPYLIARMKEELKAQVDQHKGLRTRQAPLEQIYGSSDGINKAKALAVRAARGGSTVLIIGESGTGKEVFARTIHAMSDRCGGPFVSVNCAAIPDALMEAELFGYESGAFTGAAKGGKPGKFELASGGTILLDEIGDMSPNLQAKLLRVLQERTVERVGGIKGIRIDVRIIAATNQDLVRMVEERRFRLDLYYRLNVVTIHLPPLRERPEDIPVIVRRSLPKLNARCSTNVHSIAPDAMKMLLTHDWPGNIRELENVLERALNVVDGSVIRVEHLPEYIVADRNGQERSRRQAANVVAGGGETLDAILSHFEKETLLETLSAAGGNKAKAARKLGISRSAFYEKLARYGITGRQVPQH